MPGILPLLRALLAALFLIGALPLRAECQGQDLIAAMAAADRMALTARAHAAPFAVGNLWQARKGDQRITLVGTYHMDDPRHGATLSGLAPAIAAAHTLLVEAGPDEIASLQSMLRKDPGLIIAPPGESLYADLPRATWDQLSAALSRRGVPGVMATRLRPWYVMVALSAAPCAGMDGPGGLDMGLMTAARDRALPIRALEPADTIFRIFNTLSRPDQLALMTSVLAGEAQAEDGMVTLANAYFAGESQLMWEFTLWQAEHTPGLDPAEARRQQDLLARVVIADRNRAWLPVITAAAAEGPVLVGFGALHLPGKAGVLNLLAEQGWTVTPLGAE